MDYPADFPAPSRARVEAERLKAKRVMDQERGESPRVLYAYILRVFMAFSKEACELGKQRVWNIGDVSGASKEFLRRFTIDAFYEEGHDRYERKFPDMTSNWDGSLLQEVRRSFEKSEEWRRHEVALLEVAEVLGAKPTVAVGSVPMETAVASPGELADSSELTRVCGDSGSPALPSSSSLPEKSEADMTGTELPLQSDAVEPIASVRRAQVDAFLLNCLQRNGIKAFRKQIWEVAGHKYARQFERWQSNSPKATGADEGNFARILKDPPEKFLKDWQSIKQPKKNS
jgi:hypothetical protein